MENTNLKLQIAQMESELRKSRESQQRVEDEKERLNGRMEEMEHRMQTERKEKERKIEELEQKLEIMERNEVDNKLQIGKMEDESREKNKNLIPHKE